MRMSLLEIKGFIQWLVDSSVLAIVVADMKGEIVLMSESAKKIFGNTDKLGVGKNIAEYLYIPGGARSVMKKLRSKDFGGKGRLNPMKTTAIHSSGEKVPVEMTASIIYDKESNEIATMGIYQDLREKIQIEKEMDLTRKKLEQAEKLASMGRLAAGVAHEINNPLGGITMFTHLAMEDLPEGSPAKEKLENVIEQAERCKNIVSDLLDFSRTGPRKMETININESIDKVLSLFEQHEKLKDVEIYRELDPACPVLMGDESQIQQVMINFVYNGVEAMKQGGRLTIRTRNGKEQIEIDIEDTGHGIAPDHYSKLFDPFFSTKHETEKIGLGLSVSHGIISRYNGSINISSELGKGTCFTIIFPVVPV